MHTSFVLDGIEYVPKDVPNGIEWVPRNHAGVRIVILQRGWVMVGRWSQDGDMCSLDDASVIRVWGTSKGIGELVAGPTSTTKLDPAGHVEFHILTTVAIIDAEEDKWAASLR